MSTSAQARLVDLATKYNRSRWAAVERAIQRLRGETCPATEEGCYQRLSELVEEEFRAEREQQVNEAVEIVASEAIRRSLDELIRTDPMWAEAYKKAQT